MGLLSKAEAIKKKIEKALKISAEKSPESQDANSSELCKLPQEAKLDEKGKALRDRILRIPAGPSVPYTALSLLKAYGSFQAAICFSLENEFYSSYTSVGLGIEKITIPREKIYTPERASGDYFQFTDQEKTGIKVMDSGLDLWGFPLDKQKPWNVFLILGCADSSLFNAQSISVILRDIRNVIYPGALKQTEDDDQNSSGGQKGLESIVEQYLKMHSTIGGMVIDIPAELKNDQNKDGIKEISSMVSHFALVEELSADRCLVLLPETLDRDLIAHRLKKNLGTEIPLIFSAGSTAEVLQKIQSYR